MPQGEGIKTVFGQEILPGTPGPSLIHFWMQALSKNRLKPGGVPGSTSGQAADRCITIMREFTFLENSIAVPTVLEKITV